MASLIDSIPRWVSAELRTSIWVESGIKAPASSSAVIAKATASSTSENPLLLLIAPGSRRNDHDPVVDRGGVTRPVLVDEVCRRGILPFKIIRESPRRSGGAVQRTAGEHQDRALVVRRGREVVDHQAGRRRRRSGEQAAGSATAGNKTLRDGEEGLAIPLVCNEPADSRVGAIRYGHVTRHGHCDVNRAARSAGGIARILQPPAETHQTRSVRGGNVIHRHGERRGGRAPLPKSWVVHGEG